MSSTREYERCPRRYRFAYLDRRPEDRPVPVSWRFGSLVHAGLEAAYRLAMDQPDASRASRAVTAAAAVDANLSRYQLADVEQARGRAIWHATRALAIDAIDVAGADRILAVEEPFRDRFTDTDRLAGIPDLVLQRPDGTVEIVDHKVTRYRATPQQVRDDFQLNVYGNLARRRWPSTHRIVATLHYPTGPEAVSAVLDEAGMDAAADRVWTAAQHVTEDHDFAPRPGSGCGHCPWLPSCPEGTVHLAAAG